MGRITVVARFTAKRGKEAELKEMLLQLVKPSRADEGCIGYDLHQAFEDPGVFLFYENWQSRELLDRHAASPHVQAFRTGSKPLLAEPPELTLFEKIS